MDYKNIYNLDDKNYLLYDYIYNINTTNLFLYDEIILGQINLDDIKISVSDDDFYNQNIKDIFNYKFKLISNDDNSLLFKCYNNFSIIIKIIFYDKLESIDLFNYSINNDSLFSYLLSELVLSKKTKHILLPLINIDIKFENLINILKYINLYDKFYNELLNNNICNICCMQIRESFFKTENLKDYLCKNECYFKPLLFQIIHTLAIINNKYNNFKHNNLILQNIKIYLKNNNDVYTEYNGFKNDIFYLPNIGYDIKISNFEYSVIPKYYNTDYKSDNDNSDLVTFINDLSNLKINDCNKETKHFIKFILDTNTSNYIELLYNNYFNDYLKNPNQNNNITYDNEYLLGKKKIKSNLIIMNNNNNNNNNNKLYKRILKQDNNIDELKNSEKSLKRYYNQQGGDDNIKHTENYNYKTNKNNPFMTNDEKNVNYKRSLDEPQPDKPILLEQKIYDRQDISQKPDKHQATIIPVYDNDKYKYGLTNTMGLDSFVTAPINNNYKITLSNPLGNYTTINKIFEDILPGNTNSASNYTAITLYERTNLITFLRNSLLQINDGEDTHLSKDKTFLSYIKLLDINPYTSNKKNPYYNLPKNFIVYRAGYPIKLNKKTKEVELSKHAMGINVRVYMMTIGDYNIYNLNNQIDSDDSDLWRELKYYDFIKNQIVKKNISPNFICPILFKIDSKTNYDWDKIENLRKTKQLQSRINDILKKNQQNINSKHNFNIQDTIFNINKKQLTRMNDNNKKKTVNDKIDITINSGKSLILLTEAPTTSIVQWSQKIYNSEGTIQKMVSTGYHTIDVWKSILFQLIYSFSILQEYLIYIENLSLNYNIYIKDIHFDINSIGCWIYKVNHIDYYIPNYGYILLIDSRYNDIEIDETIGIKAPIDLDKKFKIYGKKLYTNNSIYNNNTNDDYKLLIYHQFKNIINPDNFTRTLQFVDGMIPDEKIIDLLKKMYDSTEKNIINYLISYFYEFIHNRIGTSLYVNEKQNIVHKTLYKYNTGDILAYQHRYDEYEWVIYNYEDLVTNTYFIKRMTSDNELIDDSVRYGELFYYNDKVLQKLNKNINFSDIILETYILNNS